MIGQHYQLRQHEIVRLPAGDMEYTVATNDAQSLAATFAPRLSKLDRECVLVVAFSSAKVPIGYTVASIGNLITASFDPAAILRYVILAEASGFAVLHNHPCGSIFPSEMDIVVTRALNDCAKFHALCFIDHVIIANNEYFSCRENGYLDMVPEGEEEGA